MAVRTSNPTDGGLSAAVGTVVEIKRAMVADLRECRLSRAEVAIGLTQDAGKGYSEATVDAWAAESKPHRIPVETVGAWVRVTGSRRLLDLLVAGTGLHVATAEDQGFAELGREQLRREKAELRLNKLKGDLWRTV